jgi:hypothetical protein
MRLAGDELVAAVELLQRGRAGQRALGEKTDDLAPRQRVDRRFNRRARNLWTDRNCAQQPQAPMQKARPINLVVNQETDRTRARQLQDHRVDIGDVIGQQQHSARGGNRVEADRRHAIKGASNQTKRQSKQTLRRQENDIGRQQSGRDRIEQKLRAGRHAEFRRDDVLNEYGHNAKEIHEQIVGAENATAPLRFDLLLQMGVQRHDKQRAGDAHQEKRPQENRAFGIGLTRQDRSTNQPARADGNKTDLHLMRGHPRDEEAAADNAQPQRGGIEAGVRGGADLVRVQGTGNLEQRQVKRPGEAVKIADAEHAQANGLLAPDIPQLSEVLPQQTGAKRLVGMRRCRLHLITGDQRAKGEQGQNAHGHLGRNPVSAQRAVAEIEQRSTRETAQQHARNCGDLDDANGRTDLRDRDDLLDDPLLGRRKKSALDAQQEQSYDRQRETVGPERRRYQEHDAELGPKAGHDYAALGKPIRDPPRCWSEEHKRQNDDRRQDGLDQLGRRFRAGRIVGKDFRRHRSAQRDQHELGGVVVQENLNLHRNK